MAMNLSAAVRTARGVAKSSGNPVAIRYANVSAGDTFLYAHPSGRMQRVRPEKKGPFGWW